MCTSLISTQFLLSQIREMFIPTDVSVHPLVLLSVVDHYNRIARNTWKRVVGVLLGQAYKDGKVDVTNAYAIPFEEHKTDPSVWFLDRNYHEEMRDMYRRVTAKEKVVGWYSSGPKIKPNDIAVHELMRKYTPNPVFVIIDVRAGDDRPLTGLPTDAYYAIEEVADESSEPKMVFRHIPSSIEAQEAEEIGVEHLLRDVKDTTVSTLSTQVSERISSLSGLETRLREVQKYLKLVVDGAVPVNHSILYLLQDIMNRLPDETSIELMRSMAVKTNDMTLIVFVNSLMRSLVALHDLINNKQAMKKLESGNAPTAADATAKDEKKAAEKKAANGNRSGGDDAANAKPRPSKE